MDLDDILWADVVKHIIVDENATFLEFGVASGNTMCALLNNMTGKYFDSSCITPNLKVFGFDSFLGLPDEDPNTPKDPSWVKGAFNLNQEMKNNNQITIKPENLYDAIDILNERFRRYDNFATVQFVEGFYDKLSPTTVNTYKIKPACFIHIDCDLYISAIQALEFLAQNKLFAPDCLVRYDDWFITGQPLWQAGESKAHKEICEKYDLNFEFVDTNGSAAVLYRYKGN